MGKQKKKETAQDGMYCVCYAGDVEARKEIKNKQSKLF